VSGPERDAGGPREDPGMIAQEHCTKPLAGERSADPLDTFARLAKERGRIGESAFTLGNLGAGAEGIGEQVRQLQPTRGLQGRTGVQRKVGRGAAALRDRGRHQARVHFVGRATGQKVERLNSVFGRGVSIAPMQRRRRQRGKGPALARRARLRFKQRPRPHQLLDRLLRPTQPQKHPAAGEQGASLLGGHGVLSEGSSGRRKGFAGLRVKTKRREHLGLLDLAARGIAWRTRLVQFSPGTLKEIKRDVQATLPAGKIGKITANDGGRTPNARDVEGRERALKRPLRFAESTKIKQRLGEIAADLGGNHRCLRERGKGALKQHDGPLGPVGHAVRHPGVHIGAGREVGAAGVRKHRVRGLAGGDGFVEAAESAQHVDRGVAGHGRLDGRASLFTGADGLAESLGRIGEAVGVREGLTAGAKNPGERGAGRGQGAGGLDETGEEREGPGQVGQGEAIDFVGRSNAGDTGAGSGISPNHGGDHGRNGVGFKARKPYRSRHRLRCRAGRAG